MSEYREYEPYRNRRNGKANSSTKIVAISMFVIIGGAVIAALVFGLLAIFNDDPSTINPDPSAAEVKTADADKDKDGFTVVVLSHNRPHNLDRLVPDVVKHDSIKRLVIMHGMEEHHSDELQDEGKVVHIKDYTNNAKYGGARRFLVPLNLIETKYVIFLDDDMVFHANTLKNMHNELKKNEDIMVGPVGRYCGSRGYSMNTRMHGLNTILTDLAACSKKNVARFQKEGWSKYEAELTRTHGNGEDLSFNHFFRTVVGTVPLKVDGGWRNYDTSNGYSSLSTHYPIRNAMCQQLFASTPDKGPKVRGMNQRN